MKMMNKAAVMLEPGKIEMQERPMPVPISTTMRAEESAIS